MRKAIASNLFKIFKSDVLLTAFINILFAIAGTYLNTI